MTYKVVLSARAEEQLREAYRWYAARSEQKRPSIRHAARDELSEDDFF